MRLRLAVVSQPVLISPFFRTFFSGLAPSNVAYLPVAMLVKRFEHIPDDQCLQSKETRR
jgi:hypothetical protein